MSAKCQKRKYSLATSVGKNDKEKALSGPQMRVSYRELPARLSLALSMFDGTIAKLDGKAGFGITNACTSVTKKQSLRRNQMDHRHDPAEIYPALSKALNARDLDAIVACYEPEACFVSKSGRAHRGAAELRDLYRAMLSNRPQMKLDVRKIIPSGGDLALVVVEWTEWTSAKHWTGIATDIVRKQSDGTWKVALDIPYGIETAHGR